MKKTTKICPKCGNTNLGLLRTLNKKVCTDCTPNTEIRWEVEPGQSPLLTAGKTPAKLNETKIQTGNEKP